MLQILAMVVSLIQLINFQSDFNVPIINKVELDELISERNNKLLLVNIWATWCIPCREEFPDLVHLSKKYSDKVDFIAISVDYEDEINLKIKPFLRKNKVGFPVYINGFSKDEKLIEYFNQNWNGALPATFIYNQNSEQVKFLEGKQSFESFSSIFDTLIN